MFLEKLGETARCRDTVSRGTAKDSLAKEVNSFKGSNLNINDVILK
jgi:hypothetical protein